jgi:hypothetical protein
VGGFPLYDWVSPWSGDSRAQHRAVTPEEMMGAALPVAEAGLAAGEQPIGAVVVLGDEIVSRAYTQEKARGSDIPGPACRAVCATGQETGFQPSAPARYRCAV